MKLEIYLGDELQATTTDYMDCVSQCNTYAKAGHEDVKAYYIYPDGTKEPYDWFKAYLELCYG